jgi:hypothetical protein
MPRKPKKTTSKAAKKAPKKLSKMSQAHGKEEKEKFEPTTLNQVWGDDGMSKYKTLDTEEYEKQVRAMSKSELQKHSTQIGLIPIDNREILTGRLIREFSRHVAAYTVPSQSKKEPKSVSGKAMRILKEGS